MKINDWLKSRPGFNTAIGVMFAVMAGLLLLGYLTRLLNERGGGPPVAIPVAARDIEMGSLVTRDVVASRTIPARYLIPGARRKDAEVVGGRALRFIGKGEPFVPSAVAGPGAGTLAARIPADSRAYSLDLSGYSGAGPELRPGDRVDVLATYIDPPGTTTLLRGRLVLCASGYDSPGEDGDGKKSVVARLTLLVSPAEAELLAQAETVGRLSISLCPLPAPEGPGD